jgi:tetratricopeptide (TPR) repeat protein
VLLKQGQLAAARRLCEELHVVSRDLGARGVRAMSLFLLGHALAAADELSAARERYEEALALQREGGARSKAARTELALAALRLEEGNPVKAQALASGALEELQRLRAPDGEARAREVLARALLAQDRAQEAADEIARAEALAESSEILGVRLAVAVTAARLRAASGLPGDLEAARKSLQAVLVEAGKAGLAPEEFDARLALGQLEQAHGQAREGCARLEALEREAAAWGFHLIARKAAAALR